MQRMEQLRGLLLKIKASSHTKERNALIASAMELAESIRGKINSEKPSDLRGAATRVLLATAKGRMFPGARNYIRYQGEFDDAIDEIRAIVGDPEEINVK